MRKFTAVASALLCMTSVANAADGGQVDMPVTVNFTGADKCVPKSISQTNVQLSAAEAAQVESVSGYLAPTIKTGHATLTLDNCPVGTRLGITAGGNFSAVPNMQPLNNAGQPVTSHKLNDVPQWGFDGAAAGKLGMTLFMPNVTDNGYLQNVRKPSDISETKLTTANQVPLTYSINAMDKVAAKSMGSGNYNSTATLIVAIK